MTAHTDEWLTVAEACRHLKVTRATLYRWARSGKLRLYRLGDRATRLRREEIDALLHERSPAPHVTVVDSSRYEVLAFQPGLRTVKDAVERFAPGIDEGYEIYVNQEPCDNLERPLEPGDLIVVMSEKDIEASRHEGWSKEEQRGWLLLAESSFNKDWDNPADAIYDNWKELYGVRDR